MKKPCNHETLDVRGLCLSCGNSADTTAYVRFCGFFRSMAAEQLALLRLKRAATQHRIIAFDVNKLASECEHYDLPMNRAYAMRGGKFLDNLLTFCYERYFYRDYIAVETIYGNVALSLGQIAGMRDCMRDYQVESAITLVLLVRSITSASEAAVSFLNYGGAFEVICADPRDLSAIEVFSAPTV